VIALKFLIFAIERVYENTGRLTGCSILVQLPQETAWKLVVVAIERVYENTGHLDGCSTPVQFYPRKQLGYG
jgi:hypothetical protein